MEQHTQAIVSISFGEQGGGAGEGSRVLEARARGS